MRHAQQWVVGIALAVVVLWPSTSRAADELKDLEVTLEVFDNETDDLDASIARLQVAERAAETSEAAENDGFVDDADNSDADAERDASADEARDVGFENDPEFNDDERLRREIVLDEEEEVELDLVTIEDPDPDMN